MAFLVQILETKKDKGFIATKKDKIIILVEY